MYTQANLFSDLLKIIPGVVTLLGMVHALFVQKHRFADFVYPDWRRGFIFLFIVFLMILFGGSIIFSTHICFDCCSMKFGLPLNMLVGKCIGEVKKTTDVLPVSYSIDPINLIIDVSLWYLFACSITKTSRRAAKNPATS